MGRFEHLGWWIGGIGLSGLVLIAAIAACSAGDASTGAEAVHGIAEIDTTSAQRTAWVDSLRYMTTPLDSLFFDHHLPLFAVSPFDSAGVAHWVDSVMATLTLDEKIGQLFIVRLPKPGLGSVLDDDAMDAVRKVGVGGFLVPRLLVPDQVFRETRRLQAASKVPLFFAADYERGAGRFNNALTDLPSNMALGATRDTMLAAAAGRLTALEARALGVNLLFAPVVDVNNNPANPIINIRSYGEDPNLVGRMAAAFVREAERYGVLTTLKHFPGHGNTAVDSHVKMGVIRGDAAALDSVELRPYRVVLGHGPAPAGVMSAHLWVPAFDPKPLPATFSRRVLHDLLRDSLGFNGFVVTDDIQMGALRDVYNASERVLRPLRAGADVILTPRSLSRAVRIVKTAFQDGNLDAATIDRSVRRILTAKARARLHRQRFADPTMLDYLLERSRGAYLAQLIADRAVTLLKTDAVLPLRFDQRITLIQVCNVRSVENLDAAMDFFARVLGADDDIRPADRSSNAAEEQVYRAAAAADVVVLALYLRLQSGRGEVGLSPEQEQFIRRLLDADVPVVVVTFGNPYAVIPFTDARAVVVAYDQSMESLAAMAGVLQGIQPAHGRLPITVDSYSFGSGLQGVE